MNEKSHYEQIKEIKYKLRLAMNGEISQSMNEKGMQYQTNWGLTIPQLKEIASGYSENFELASALWEEEVRECKILSVMIQPLSGFTPHMADHRVRSVEYPDLVEILSFFLFRRLSFASWISFKWIADEDDLIQYCGYLTLAHLFRNRLPISENYLEEFKNHAATAIAGGSFLPKQGAIKALESYEYNYGVILTLR